MTRVELGSIQHHLLASLKVYLKFLKNPVQEIRQLPDWSWRIQIINQLAFTALMGAISGLLRTSILSIAQGIIFVPIMTAITISIGTLFFYFFFQILASITLDFRRLMELLFFANIPFFIFQTVAHWFPPISLFGLGIASLLMIVGLTDNFRLEKKLVIRTVAGVYILFTVVWLMSRLDSMKADKRANLPYEAPSVELGK